MSKPVAVEDSTFEKMVLKADRPVLVDFWAEWCNPCKMLLPVVDKISAAYDGRAKVGKVNIDESRDIAVKYGIQSIPTLMLFKNGEPVETFVGIQPEKVLVEAMEKHL